MKSSQDLKASLGTQEKRIARAFFNNLLKFTHGRELVVADHAKLDAIVEANVPTGLRTADLYAGYLRSYFLD
ncbi:MAG: hypothetical protein ACI8W8_002328 [Rhodothermales bacterium]